MRTVVLVALLTSLAPAQQVGYRDLTVAWQAPDDHIPTPTADACPNLNSTITSGAVVNGVPKPSASPQTTDKIELVITEITPTKLVIGGKYIASVRLKNTGASTFRVPWQPDGEKVMNVSQVDTEEQYEVADITFRLASGTKKNSPTPLTTEGALFAHPGDAMTYIDVEPGRWLDIKIKGVVECGLDRCLSEVVADQHAVLTAWWYQRLLTHRVKGCDEDHGSYKVREADSVDFPIVVLPLPKTQSGVPEHSAE